MHGSLTRVSDSAFQVIVFRSMAQTLVHDLKRAMISVEARASLLK
jgi:sarcosine oxidase subunit gamma